VILDWTPAQARQLEADGKLSQLREPGRLACVPFWWFKGNRGFMHNSSACVVATPTRLVGITADHVLTKFLADRGTTDGVQARFGNAPFDPEACLIDRDQTLDLCTFAIDAKTLLHSGSFPLTPSVWPPEQLKQGRFVMIGGYWGQHREILTSGVMFRFLHFLGGLYHAPSDTHCTLHLDARTFIATRGAVLDPQPNLGGLSGGPVYYVSSRFQPELAGVIIEGHTDFELLRIHTASCIRADGRLVRY
jgi:hypothetical protein